MPALLKRRSSFPNRSLVLLNKLFTASGSVTSVGTARLDAADWVLIRIVSSRASARRPASTTEYPSFNKASAA